MAIGDLRFPLSETQLWALRALSLTGLQGASPNSVGTRVIELSEGTAESNPEYMSAALITLRNIGYAALLNKENAFRITVEGQAHLLELDRKKSIDERIYEGLKRPAFKLTALLIALSLSVTTILRNLGCL